MRQQKGVCCECQGVNPVRIGREKGADLYEGFDDFEYELGQYVMDSHDAFGQFCEGSGTMPQVLVSPRMGMAA